MIALTLVLTALLWQGEPAVEPPPFEGSALEGLGEMIQHATTGDLGSAERIAEELLAREPVAGEDSLDAELWYALGVIRHRAGRPLSAARAFQAAMGPAGPGELRLDAAYDAGVMYLLDAEAAYELIPEVAEQNPSAPPGPMALPNLPPLPGAPAVTGTDPTADEEPQEDPIEAARRKYRRSKSALVERLRMDASDEDTRANLEWIARRLAELREIEEQREEQEPQEGEPSDEENQDEEGGSDEEQEEEGESEESEEQDEESGEKSEPEEGEDGEEEQQQESEESPEDSEEPAEDETPTERDEDEQTALDESQQPTENEEAEAAPEPDPEEVQEVELSPQEIQRLLERLEDVEDKGERLRELLRKWRRVPVEKDW